MSTSDPAHPRHLRAKCHFDKKQDMTRSCRPWPAAQRQVWVGRGPGWWSSYSLVWREKCQRRYFHPVSQIIRLWLVFKYKKHRQSTQTWDKRSSGSCLCRWGGNCRDIARTWNIIVSIFGPVINHHSQEILLSARRRIPDRRCLVARVALHHMLVFLARDVDHCLRSHCL